MEDLLNIYKPLGATPLEAIKMFQEQNPGYSNIKMGYAGRLDPLAEGVLLVLAGNRLKSQSDYMELNKEYEAEILLGFETDSQDILGVVNKTSEVPKVNEKEITSILKNIEGNFTATLPPYSSYRIDGKPLFWWARKDRLQEIKIPKKTSQIYSTELLSVYKIKKDVLLNDIEEKVDYVNGDFRQEEIKEKWKQEIENRDDKEYCVVKIKVGCSSGTYIRSLAQIFGVKLKTRAVLYHLKRTKVGSLDIKDSIKLNQ